MSHKLAKLQRLRQGQVEKEVLLLDRLIQQDQLIRQMVDALEASSTALLRYANGFEFDLNGVDQDARVLTANALRAHRVAQDAIEDGKPGEQQ